MRTALHVIALACLLSSCQKSIGPDECNARYNDLIKSSNKAHTNAEEQIAQFPQNRANIIATLNATIDGINSNAHNLDGCCCWNDIPHAL